MKRLSILCAALLASCASPGTLDTDQVVGTWSGGGHVSLRLRSNGRGYINFADRGAGFVDWTLEGSKVRMTITPEAVGGACVAQVDPKSNEMVLIEPDRDPLFLERISTEEPPDLDKKLGIAPAAVPASPAKQPAAKVKR